MSPKSTYKIKENLKVKELSRGMSTKLMMAIALCHGAKTLILDEPTSGLDPAAREEFRDMIQAFMDEDEEHTVLFSTHITTDLEAIADFILFIQDGNKVFYGTKDDLLEEFRLIKADHKEFTKLDEATLIGVKQFDTRSEALIKTKYSDLLNDRFIVERPTIDSIVTFFNRGEYYE